MLGHAAGCGRVDSRREFAEAWIGVGIGRQVGPCMSGVTVDRAAVHKAAVQAVQTVHAMGAGITVDASGAGSSFVRKA